jgi:hypothetical protein
MGRMALLACAAWAAWAAAAAIFGLVLDGVGLHGTVCVYCKAAIGGKNRICPHCHRALGEQ